MLEFKESQLLGQTMADFKVNKNGRIEVTIKEFAFPIFYEGSLRGKHKILIPIELLKFMEKDISEEQKKTLELRSFQFPDRKPIFVFPVKLGDKNNVIMNLSGFPVETIQGCLMKKTLRRGFQNFKKDLGIALGCEPEFLNEEGFEKLKILFRNTEEELIRLKLVKSTYVHHPYIFQIQMLSTNILLEDGSFDGTCCYSRGLIETHEPFLFKG